MASSRNINAPGIELREIDRSAQSTQDNSLPNAPVVLITGVADKGNNYYPQWINTKQTFIQKFGSPSTEEEKYFYNACADIVDRGGVCIASKLPYDNVESRDGGSFTYCDYIVNPVVVTNIDESIPGAKSLDSNLTSFLQIYSAEYGHNGVPSSGTISLDDVDQLRTGMKSGIKNHIRIIDVSKQKYTKANFNCVSTDYSSGVQTTNDALGLFPVITTASNALLFQNLVSFGSSGTGLEIGKFNPVNELSTVKPQTGIHVNLSALYDESIIKCSDISSTASQTVSKIAVDQFPQLKFRDQYHLDDSHLKDIGVVVFRAFADSSNSGKVNVEVLETFVGSLSKNAKSQTDKSSRFIDTLVNNNSQYINLFSNVSDDLLNQVPLLHINNQRSRMLGFFQKDCEKTIDVTKTIIDPLTKILDYCKDPNQFPIDLVVDAGVSNIAQYYRSLGSLKPEEFIWKLNAGVENIETETSVWKQVIKKFDDFCHFTRKDCMFIADGLRPFCLIGDQKIVRKSKLGSSVEKDIIPLVRHLIGVNSSYSAGYCDWFQIADEYSGDLMWCPPSIKAASIYVYCDTYFHTWDAPAGMTRGIVPNAIDVAFSPTIDEAGKIYDQSWNYAINYPIDGIIMEGQKTFQTNKTALDRVNVRRLLLKLEKQVARAAKYFLYEGNTAYRRQKFVDTIRPYFEAAVNGAGISEYAIKCDDELNTTQVIENNELRCKIAVKPIKTIEFIILDFIATSQSASVSEEVLK